MKGIDQVNTYEQVELGTITRLPTYGMDYRICRACQRGYNVRTYGSTRDIRCPHCDATQARNRADKPDERATCDDCGSRVDTVIGCPDGAEICQACFDGGAH